MALPQISSRRWYWLLMAAGVAWAWAGSKWGGDIGHPGWMRSLESGVMQPVRLVETPATWLATLGREATTGAVRKVAFRSPGAGPGGAGMNDEEMQAALRNLQNENAQMKQMLVEANERLMALQHMQMIGIGNDDVVVATVAGMQAGSGSSTLSLDKGKMDGVKQRDAVVAALEQASVLGWIETAGEKESVVRLLTDPRMSVAAQIVRPRTLPAGARGGGGGGVVTDVAVTSEPCMVQGMGNHLMRSLDVNVQGGVTPLVGDLVRLADRGWPAKTQHMVIGEITEVKRRDDQALRYELVITPRVAVVSQRTVMVLTRE